MHVMRQQLDFHFLRGTMPLHCVQIRVFYVKRVIEYFEKVFKTYLDMLGEKKLDKNT